MYLLAKTEQICMKINEKQIIILDFFPTKRVRHVINQEIKTI